VSEGFVSLTYINVAYISCSTGNYCLLSFEQTPRCWRKIGYLWCVLPWSGNSTPFFRTPVIWVILQVFSCSVCTKYNHIRLLYNLITNKLLLFLPSCRRHWYLHHQTTIKLSHQSLQPYKPAVPTDAAIQTGKSTYSESPSFPCGGLHCWPHARKCLPARQDCNVRNLQKSIFQVKFLRKLSCHLSNQPSIPKQSHDPSGPIEEPWRKRGPDGVCLEISWMDQLIVQFPAVAAATKSSLSSPIWDDAPSCCMGDWQWFLLSHFDCRYGLCIKYCSDFAVRSLVLFLPCPYDDEPNPYGNQFYQNM
jgi:hypothetical protein